MSVYLAGGAGCEPPVPLGVDELTGEALSGVVRGGRQSWIPLQHGNLRQQPLAWNIIKHTPAPRNRNATN